MPSQLSAMSQINDNLRRFFRIAGERAKREERETGLTGRQLWAFKLIAESAPVKISDLVRRMQLHPSTIGGMLDRLEAKGILNRSRSRSDRRVVRVVLTNRGKELAGKSTELERSVLLPGLRRLSGDRLDNIARALNEIVGILDGDDMPGG